MAFSLRPLAILLLTATFPGFGATGATEPELQEAGMAGIAIKPSATDAAIQNFDLPHFIYVDRAVILSHEAAAPPDRHELLLFLSGTGGSGRGAVRFCQTAARQGYRVINLTYPTAIAAAVCRDDPAPTPFEDFRMAIIIGGRSERITVSRTDSIENRLLKLLAFLQANRPKEDWGQFLNAKGELNWEMIAVAGQSQGGGHAALLGIKHRLARVIGTGAPKDYSIALAKPAAWYSEKAQTPKDRFFFLNHVQDYQGCTPEECQENIRAMGLGAFGAPVSVDTVPLPYRHAHSLTTDYPGGKKLDSMTAHTTVIAGTSEAFLGKVWEYMLTEKVP